MLHRLLRISTSRSYMITTIRPDSPKGGQMLHRSRVRLASLLCVTVGGLWAAVPFAGAAAAAPAASHRTASQAAAAPGTLWATPLDFDDNGAPWSVASLAALQAD